MTKDNVSYQKISPMDYNHLTKIMISAFNEDTFVHTGKIEDGPSGYDDGSLIKKLNENKNFESFKILYGNILVGAYTVGVVHEKEYSLEMLFIDPAYRGNHIGSKVWQDIELKYNHARKWLLETPDYSTRNHYFYTQKCGFALYEEKTYNNGSKSLIFVKEK